MRSIDIEKVQTKQNKTKQNKRPPNLIFLETHDDPAVKIILLKMLNGLQKLGYASFYHEYPEHKNADAVINDLKMVQNWLLNLTNTTMEANGGKMPSYNDLNKIYKNSNKISFILKRVPGCLANLSLMEELKKTKIAYRSIDIDTEDHNYKQSSKGMNARDQHMAKHYLNSDSPVFGLAGVGHSDGLKKCLKESNEFEYIFMYSSSHSGLKGGDLEIHKLWLTEGIPEGVHIFDIDELGHDNTIEAIFDIIKNHEEQILTTPKKSKETATSLPTRPILFLADRNPITKVIDVSNYLFDNKYIPSVVSNVIEVVLNDNNIEKLFPKPVDLSNLLSSIFIVNRPTINQLDRDKLKIECFDLLLKNKTYFSKFDGTERLFSKLKTIFPERSDEILNLCQATPSPVKDSTIKTTNTFKGQLNEIKPDNSPGEDKGDDNRPK